MQLKIRRVPANWEHPKDDQGQFIPMFERFPYPPAEIEEGLQDGWLINEPPNYGVAVMPDWPDRKRTHVQLYENITEGTPVSPVLGSPEELARWIKANGGPEAVVEKTAELTR